MAVFSAQPSLPFVAAFAARRAARALVLPCPHKQRGQGSA